MFVDRRPRDDRFLEWKVRLFTVAAVLALLGMALGERWLAGLAIAVLVVALSLRFLPGGGVAEGDDGVEGEGGATGGPDGSEGGEKL